MYFALPLPGLALFAFFNVALEAVVVLLLLSRAFELQDKRFDLFIYSCVMPCLRSRELCHNG